VFGRAAMLRMKYLYEANRFAAILDEAPPLRDDARCKLFVPQILYLQWVSHRREGQTDQAASVMRTFLDAYPTHPLGADMQFAAAMALLSEGDYAGASQALDRIEYRYPDSALIPKVRQLQARVRKLLDGAKPQNAAPRG
jgi:outer membrane protein assembly factor BamD (BamD/ComL family)